MCAAILSMRAGSVSSDTYFWCGTTGLSSVDITRSSQQKGQTSLLEESANDGGAFLRTQNT